ncbi:hypothetical protein BST27_21655 [Mycobacterium intermedium]|uniref:Uncharacterized protein n=1 Tax=Mycobacterium intermedium TaxID=28445 RepID=A0A1E3S998_MYCIE|nr:hypothetical protein BHQ20_20745 [Mycobacterium intermedium]OPE50126.1 hypothetical protein BV508_11575 [Mycobacterium intermedium]ORA97908.1 hypothetical protein BST27_21655 [Mycobacterium intermedium]
MPASDAISIPEAAVLPLIPDAAALIAEVEAVLEALAPAPLPPAPPATGCDLMTPRSAGRPWAAPACPWREPAHRVRPVQRSPPASRDDLYSHLDERQVMALAET